MPKCSSFALGVGGGSGPTKAEAKYKAGLAAYARAVANAELAANKDCPEGHACIGMISVMGKPSFTSLGKGKGKKKFAYIAMVNVAYSGECQRVSGGDAPSEGGGSDCIRAIKAKNIREFFHKVEMLPKLPDNPEGPCCMYRRKVGKGFWVPVCAGKCEKGACRTVIKVKKKKVSAFCTCG
jgi:hypothetical protein